MKRILTTLAILSLFTLGLMGVAGAHEHIPEHPHAMLKNVQLNGEGDLSGFDDCFELANGRALPLEAHHHSLHTGTPGVYEPLKGMTRTVLTQDNPSGHAVIPLAPYSGFEDCEAIEAVLGAS